VKVVEVILEINNLFPKKFFKKSLVMVCRLFSKSFLKKIKKLFPFSHFLKKIDHVG
jgi:hypothetical protein